MTSRRSECRRLLTHTHIQTEEWDGDSARSTRVFLRAESASRNPAQENDYGENSRREGLGPSSAALRPP